MIRVSLYGGADHPTGFSVSGHSGYSEAGSDIICAAVTSAVRLTECTIDDILGCKAAVTADSETADISLQMPDSAASREDALAVLQGFSYYMKTLAEENPNYIQVMEV